MNVARRKAAGDGKAAGVGMAASTRRATSTLVRVGCGVVAQPSARDWSSHYLAALDAMTTTTPCGTVATGIFGAPPAWRVHELVGAFRPLFPGRQLVTDLVTHMLAIGETFNRAR